MRDRISDDDHEGHAPAEPAVPPRWAALVEALIRRAAELAVANDVDPDSFMRAAWAVYVEHRSDLRAHLEANEIAANLDDLRAHGHVGSA